MYTTFPDGVPYLKRNSRIQQPVDQSDMCTIEYTLPVHWAPSLINGDDSGLDEEELEQLDAFTNYMVDKYGTCYCIDAKLDDVVFTSFHDANDVGVLACECAIFVFEA